MSPVTTCSALAMSSSVAGKLPHHPTGQDFLERAVEDRAGELGVEVVPELAGLLAVGDDALERLDACGSRRSGSADCSGLRVTSRTSTRTRSGSRRQVRRSSATTLRTCSLAGPPSSRPRGSRRASAPTCPGRSSRAALPSSRSSGRRGRTRRPLPLRSRRRGTRGSPCARTREPRRRGSGAASPPERRAGTGAANSRQHLHSERMALRICLVTPFAGRSRTTSTSTSPGSPPSCGSAGTR